MLPSSSTWLPPGGRVLVLTQDRQELHVRPSVFAGWTTASNVLEDTGSAFVYLHNMTADVFMQLLAIQQSEQLDRYITVGSFMDLVELATYWDIRPLLHLFVPRLASVFHDTTPVPAPKGGLASGWGGGCCQLMKTVGIYFCPARVSVLSLAAQGIPLLADTISSVLEFFGRYPALEHQEDWGIIHACNTGNAAALEFLLASPRIEPTDATMYAALVHACGAPCIGPDAVARSSIVQMLLSSGKMPSDWRSFTGSTALTVVCESGNARTVEILLRAGVVPSHRDIQVALENQHGEVVSLLLYLPGSVGITQDQTVHLRAWMPDLYERWARRRVKARTEELGSAGLGVA